jgi:hypothetical protein
VLTQLLSHRAFHLLHHLPPLPHVPLISLHLCLLPVQAHSHP